MRETNPWARFRNGVPFPLLSFAFRARCHPDTVMRRVERGQYPEPIEVEGMPARLTVSTKARPWPPSKPTSKPAANGAAGGPRHDRCAQPRACQGRDMLRAMSDLSDWIATEAVSLTQMAANRKRCERTIYRMIKLGELPPMIELIPGRKCFLRSQLSVFIPKPRPKKPRAPRKAA
jgi:predicted DNA-binding transcriptional regulator AlpA